MNENKKGYWIYSIIVAFVGMVLFAYWGYLIYNLILKLTVKELSNNTLIQALISLIVTVFLGGYFSKWLERRNAKKLEIFKTKRDISLNIIDYASIIYFQPENEQAKRLFVGELSKIILYFDEETIKTTQEFINEVNKNSDIDAIRCKYDVLIKQLKKSMK